MPMTSAANIPPVPAETLFPNWRGRLPFRDRLPEAESALHRVHPGLAGAIAALPFARFEESCGARVPVFKYNVVPDAATKLLAQLPAEHDQAWLCALLIWHMDRFEQAFAAGGLPAEFALHYADAFHRILDQIENAPDFAVASSDSFLKDLWLTRAVMIPAFAQLWWPHAGISAAPLLRAGPLFAAKVVLGCGGRKPFLEGHTHDPTAKAYWNEAGWGEALRLAALALPALPHARGVFGSAWFYDPAIKQVSPRVAYTQDLQVDCGAWQVRVGSNPAAIANATATSPTRRSLYEEGSYVPADYMVIWSRRRLFRAYGS